MKCAGHGWPSGPDTGNLDLLGAMAAESLEVQQRDRGSNVNFGRPRSTGGAASASFNLPANAKSNYSLRENYPGSIKLEGSQKIPGRLPFNNARGASVQVRRKRDLAYHSNTSTEAKPKKIRTQPELSRTFVPSDGSFSRANSEAWMPNPRPPSSAKHPAWDKVPAPAITTSAGSKPIMATGLTGTGAQFQTHEGVTVTRTNVVPALKQVVRPQRPQQRPHAEIARDFKVPDSGLAPKRDGNMPPAPRVPRGFETTNRPARPVRPPQPKVIREIPKLVRADDVTGIQVARSHTNVKFCERCKRSAQHTSRRYSVHCRDERNIRNTYTSCTCHHCGRETSVCPNHESGEFNHSDRKNTRLVWRRLPSQHTPERVWEMECKACVQERYIRKNIEKRDIRRAEVSRKLAKLTTKWTRCNHCKALYKKCKGVKGVHSSDKCKVLRPGIVGNPLSTTTSNIPNAPTAPTCPMFPGQWSVAELIQFLLAKKEFLNLPANLREKVLEQCREKKS